MNEWRQQAWGFNGCGETAPFRQGHCASPAHRVLTIATVIICLSLTGCFSGGGGVTPIQTAYNRGIAFYTAGQYDRAIYEFRQAIRNDPNDTRARFNLALSLDTMARNQPVAEREAVTDEAVAEYRQVLKRDPQNISARINLAAIAFERGDTGRAISELEAVIADHPKAAAPRAALANLHLQSGDPQTARAIVVDAQRFDPANPRLWFLRGQCDEALGDDATASRAYTTVMKTDPDDLGALLALARIQMKLNQPSAAWGNARRVLFIDPDNWRAHLIAADAAEQQGRLPDAAYHLALARDLDHQRPGDEPAIDYNARLRGLYLQLAERTETQNADANP